MVNIVIMIHILYLAENRQWVNKTNKWFTTARTVRSTTNDYSKWCKATKKNLFKFPSSNKNHSRVFEAFENLLSTFLRALLQRSQLWYYPRFSFQNSFATVTKLLCLISKFPAPVSIYGRRIVFYYHDKQNRCVCSVGLHCNFLQSKRWHLWWQDPVHPISFLKLDASHSGFPLAAVAGFEWGFATLPTTGRTRNWFLMITYNLQTVTKQQIWLWNDHDNCHKNSAIKVPDLTPCYNSQGVQQRKEDLKRNISDNLGGEVAESK